MKSVFRFSAVILAVLVFVAAASASTTVKTFSVSGSSSYQITAQQHEFQTRYFGPRVYDGNGAVVSDANYSYTINDDTLLFTIQFGSTFAGTIKLEGLFGGTNTEHWWDWYANASFDDDIQRYRVTVCGICGEEYGYAIRNVNGKRYVGKAYFQYTHSSSASGTLRVYLKDNKLVFGLSGSSGQASGYCEPSARASHCAVVNSVSSFPAGSVAIAEAEYGTGNYLGSLTDRRPW